MLIRFTCDGDCYFETYWHCKFDLEFMLGEVKVVEVAIIHKSISPPRVQTGEGGWRSTICMKVKV